MWAMQRILIVFGIIMPVLWNNYAAYHDRTYYMGKFDRVFLFLIIQLTTKTKYAVSIRFKDSLLWYCS